MITNKIIQVGASRWKIREATTMEAAEYAIALARCSGSVGTKTSENEIVQADVVRLNEDDTECQPR